MKSPDQWLQVPRCTDGGRHPSRVPELRTFGNNEMLKTLFFSLIAVLFAGCTCPLASHQTQDRVVNLAGTVSRITFPGPPNYKNTKTGDEPETYWILYLDSAVDLMIETPDAQAAKETNVSEIQLVLEPEQYSKYRTLLSRHVLATGILQGQHTGHHHTRVLMTVSKLQ